jgi:hypothetical protein
MNRWLTAIASLTGLGLSLSPLQAAEPGVLELRTQKVDGTTYFQVRLERPADLRLPTFDTGRPFSDSDRRNFARLPRLVPQNDKARAVYYRHRLTQPGLNFCGQATGEGTAKFVLLYPLAEAEPAKDLSLADLVRSPGIAEVPVEVDFAKAVVVPIPKVDPDDQHLDRNDLRGSWALHQAAYFAVLETQVIDFPFYGFAREATGRKYGVVSPAWVKKSVGDAEHRLYEITTGADAIAETLQLHRMLQPDGRGPAERSVDISRVRGITVPEQPWDRMLGGKKPAIEPLARLVPHDNYYVHFKNIRKLIEFGELLDQWGTSILRVYEMKSRDCELRERYEKQLCLKSTGLAKTLGPALVKGVAITGSDPYVREGTDITVIFHVANRPLFLGAVEGFIKEAKQEQGDRLHEGKEEYHGVTIEKWVTPLREVSLHRAMLDDFVIYSNSPAGIRRVLDTHRKAGKSLAEASDFRYMRTLFAPEDEKEDGFVYLSDASIRQLTGPAARIKEKRRLEALTSLSMMTNAALFCAWETGKLPADTAGILAGAGLRPADVAVPEGKAIRWDARQQQAVSDAYGTIHFATPLCELPIDRITRAEETAYDQFRDEYSKLWRTYFDPIGIRVAFDDRRVRVETHILPLAGSEQYQALRALAGRGQFPFDPRREGVVEFRLSVGEGASFGLHVDESALLRDVVELLIRWEADPRVNLRKEYDRLFWKLPLGVSLRGPEMIVGDASGIVDVLKNIGKDQPKQSQYKDVTIIRVPIDEEKYRQAAAFLTKATDQSPLATLLAVLPTQEAPAALHVTSVDKVVYLTANEDLIKKLIDQAAGKKPGEKPVREVNSGLFISPANAGPAASLFLEYEGHSLALLNNQVWNSFYQTGLLAPDATEAVRKETARRFLGSIPVSPDGTPYRYDARLGEVLNGRHGSLRRPDLHSRVAEGSELARVLDQLRSLRAELQFGENSLHTVLTIERR